MCLPLVKKREVELKSGKCIVPCSKWEHLLAILFHMHLELGMKQLQASGCVHEALNDSRIYQLAQELGTRLVFITRISWRLIIFPGFIISSSILFCHCTV